MTNFTVTPTPDGVLLLDGGTCTTARLAFPTTPTIDSIKLRSRTQAYVSVAHSFRRNVRSTGGQRWGFTVVYRKLTRDEFAPVMAYLERQRGQLRAFLFAPPLPLLTPRGTVAGSSPVVDGGAQSGEVLRVRGCAASTTVLKAGDFFRVSGHNKVYMATEDARSNSTGYMQIQMSPPLQATPNDGETVQISGVAFNMAQAADVREYELTAPTLYDFEVELMEAPE